MQAAPGKARIVGDLLRRDAVAVLRMQLQQRLQSVEEPRLTVRTNRDAGRPDGQHVPFGRFGQRIALREDEVQVVFGRMAFALLAHALDRRRAQVTGQRPGYGVRSIDPQRQGLMNLEAARKFAHGDGFGKQRILLRAAFAGAAQQQRRDKKQKAIREHVENRLRGRLPGPGIADGPGSEATPPRLRAAGVRTPRSRQEASDRGPFILFMQFCPKLRINTQKRGFG